MFDIHLLAWQARQKKKQLLTFDCVEETVRPFAHFAENYTNEYVVVVVARMEKRVPEITR